MMKPQEDEQFEAQWIITALAYFHHLSENHAKKIFTHNSIYIEKTHFILTSMSHEYWIPYWIHKK